MLSRANAFWKEGGELGGFMRSGGVGLLVRVGVGGGGGEMGNLGGCRMITMGMGAMMSGDLSRMG